MIRKPQNELQEDLEFIESEIKNIKEKLLFLTNPVDIRNTQQTLTDYCEKQTNLKQQLNNK